MTSKQPQIRNEGVSVVVLGSFNPRIFEPLWLASQNLAPLSEAESATVQLIEKEFAQIGLPWANVVVMGDRLQVQSTEIVSPAQIRDLVVGVLRVLPHTPVTAVSIQHSAHLELESEQQWHDVGHRLAPKDLWKGILEKPGLLDFAMEGTRDDDLPGAIKVRLQPSTLIRFGVFVNVNDEFFMNEKRASDSARVAAGHLEEVWPSASTRVDQIRAALLERLVA
jgi:hypothetical protein